MLSDIRLVTGTVTAVTANGDPGNDPLSEPDQRTSGQKRREAERLKKQRQRERRRDRERQAAIAEAERAARQAEAAERAAEALAPAVMRRAVETSDRVLLGPRVQIVDGRPVRALALGTMNDPVAERGPKSVPLSDRERAAALKFQADWAEVGAGLRVGAVDYLRVGGGGSPGAVPPGFFDMLNQIETRRDLDAALAYVGAFAPMLARIVLDCIPVSVWVGEENATRAARTPPATPIVDGVAWLRAGLGRLADFYWPVGSRSVGILTLAPARAAYEIACDHGTT